MHAYHTQIFNAYRPVLHDSDKYLDDEIINRYLTHCLTQEDEHISSKLGRKRSYFFNSFFVQTMFDEKNSNPNLRGHYHYKNVERWSKKVHEKDIFNMKYIFVPINKDSIHWTLAVIDMEKKCIQYYDSRSGDKDAAKFGSKIMDGLLTYVADEYKKNNGGEEEMNVSEWELINCCSTASPQQSNGYDCGPFLCMTCKCILNDSALVFDQSHMNQCWDNILVSILNGIPTALALEQCTNEPNIADVGSPASCVVSSPQQPLHTKRKAKAENTPSGVDRQNQSQKCDINLNAGNMAAAINAQNITNNTFDLDLVPKFKYSRRAIDFWLWWYIA